MIRIRGDQSEMTDRGVVLVGKGVRCCMSNLKNDDVASIDMKNTEETL